MDEVESNATPEPAQEASTSTPVEATPVTSSAPSPDSASQPVSAESAASSAPPETPVDSSTPLDHVHLTLIKAFVQATTKLGMHGGLGFDQATNQHFVAVDLPVGQVHWIISDSDLPTFEGLPLYSGSLEQSGLETILQRLHMSW